MMSDYIDYVLDVCLDLPEGGTRVTHKGFDFIEFEGIDETNGRHYVGIIDDESEGYWHYTDGGE